MANEYNLKPFTSNQSREEAVRNGRKGGKKSAEARRKKKMLKECMEVLLDLDIKDRDLLKEFEAMGIKDKSNKMLIAFGLFNAAIGGNVKAFHEIRKLIGEDGKDTDLSRLDELLDSLGKI